MSRANTSCNRERNSQREYYYSSSPGERRCFHCDRPGHSMRVCPEIRCYRCGDYGHLAKGCGGRRHPESVKSVRFVEDIR